MLPMLHLSHVIRDDSPAFCHVSKASYFIPFGAQIMKRLLIVAAAFLLSHQPAQATDISVVAEETSDHPALILIKGQLMREERGKDVSKFADLASAHVNPAVVFLDSPGGGIWTAIDIGLIINQDTSAHHD